jgi:hypothetical protein
MVQRENGRKGMRAAPAAATMASPRSGTHDSSSAGAPYLRTSAEARSMRRSARSLFTAPETVIASA